MCRAAPSCTEAIGLTRLTERHGRREVEGDEAADAVVGAEGIGDPESQLAWEVVVSAIAASASNEGLRSQASSKSHRRPAPSAHLLARRRSRARYQEGVSLQRRIYALPGVIRVALTVGLPSHDDCVVRLFSPIRWAHQRIREPRPHAPHCGPLAARNANGPSVHGAVDRRTTPCRRVDAPSSVCTRGTLDGCVLVQAPSAPRSQRVDICDEHRRRQVGEASRSSVAPKMLRSFSTPIQSPVWRPNSTCLAPVDFLSEPGHRASEPRLCS